MMFGDGGNVITERLFNFTEAYVCLKRLEPDSSPEVPQSTAMQRRSVARRAPDSSETAKRSSPRAPARTKPTTAVAPSSGRSIRSPSAIKKEDVVKIPAKRNQLNDGAEITTPHVEKTSHRNNRSPKQTNEKKDRVSCGGGVADLKRDVSDMPTPQGTQQGIGMEHLRECSIILKSVEIPDTVYLDKKTKKRLSSLFRACRKSGKNRTKVSQEDSALDTDSPDTGVSTDHPEAKEESRKKGRETRVRAAIGKRRRDSAIEASASSGDETSKTPKSGGSPATNTSNLRRQKRLSLEKTPAAGSSENPAKRRRVSTKTNGKASLIKSGRKASRSGPNERTSANVDDADDSSMCWDETPDKSPEQVRNDEAVISGIPSKSPDSDLALQRLSIPALGYLNGGGIVPKNYLAVPQSGRCAHCSCPCKIEEQTVDKNQPLITSFLRRTSREPRHDTQSNPSPATTESQAASSSTAESRDEGNVGIENSTEPIQDRPGDNESIFADSPLGSTREEAPEVLPTEITSQKESDQSHDAGLDVNVESPAIADEGCAKSVDDLPEVGEERAISPEDSRVSELIQDTASDESVVCEEDPTVAEETCNESEKDQCSVKLILEESSDGSRADECEIAENGAVATWKSSPSDAETKCGDVHDESAREPETSVSTEAVVKDGIAAEEIGNANRDEDAEPEKLETRESRAEGDSAPNDTCDSEKETDFEAGARADPPSPQKQVSVTGLEGMAETTFISEASEEKNSSKLDESGEKIQNDEKKSSMEPIVLDENSEKGLEAIKDAEIEIKLTSEIPVDAEESSEPGHVEHDEACEESEAVVKVPATTADKDRHDDDEICDTVNALSSGSEVLCFLGADTTENQITSVVPGVAPSMSSENSPNVDSEFKMGQGKCQSDGIGQGEAVVQVPPTVG